MSNTVTVVVPVYKDTMTIFEEVSLSQCFKVLSDYCICFVGPGSLKKHYLKEFKTAKYEEFDSSFFESTKTYSELLLSRDFYKRFWDYDYILIYQLDAFVFSDRLMEFCNKEYDYIGAPLKGKGWKKYHVGNGGFSLRKIKSFLRVLEKKEEILHDLEDKLTMLDYEDSFWGYCGYNPKIDFTVPNIYEAGEFAAALDVGHAIRAMKYRGNPFGCHEWDKLNYQVWKPVIEAEGYFLPEVDEHEYRDEMKYDQNVRLNSFTHYVLRHSDIKKLEYYREKIGITDILMDRDYYIWGTGVYGKKTLKFLKLLGINVSAFIDSKPKEEYFSSLKVITPSDIEKNSNIFIVIGSVKYELEIREHITKSGRKEGQDFSLYSKWFDLLKNIVTLEYPNISGITIDIMAVEKDG